MEALGLDIKLLIAQMVNFAIFYFIFQKFVAKPLLSYIKKQKDDEKKRHNLTSELETAKKQLDEEKSEMVKAMNTKQKELINESKKYADELKADLLAKAKKQADDLVASGKELLEEERRRAKEELEQYVKIAAKNALMKSLADKLDEDTRKKITKEIVNSI